MTDRDLPPQPDDDPEVPEADALEQRTEAVAPAEGDPDAGDLGDHDPEADPADVAEQSRTVDVEDDEYR